MEKEKFIDLHIHSNNSDGVFTPSKLVEIAHDNDVGILAIADHDSVSGLEEFKSNILGDMIGVKGIEISSYIIDDKQKEKIHILGYCFDEKDILFQNLINEMKEKRKNAHLKLLKEIREKVKKLPEEEIYKLNIDKYCWFDREVISCLENANYPNEIIEELKIYYKNNVFSYGDDYEINAIKAIDTIHSAGGYAVFAHPMAYSFSNNKDKVERIINGLIDIGIDGIEIYQSDCPMKDTIWLNKLVTKNNLLYSVGSDYHGNMNSDGREIGFGINNNLCVLETSLTNEIIKSKKYFKR